jgi:hypothetical protein
MPGSGRCENVASYRAETALDLLRCYDTRTIEQLADELVEGELRETVRRTLVEWFEAGLLALD